jgi:hypothetical protein
LLSQFINRRKRSSKLKIRNVIFLWTIDALQRSHPDEASDDGRRSRTSTIPQERKLFYKMRNLAIRAKAVRVYASSGGLP